MENYCHRCGYELRTNGAHIQDDGRGPDLPACPDPTAEHMFCPDCGFHVADLHADECPRQPAEEGAP